MLVPAITSDISGRKTDVFHTTWWYCGCVCSRLCSSERYEWCNVSYCGVQGGHWSVHSVMVVPAALFSCSPLFCDVWSTSSCELLALSGIAVASFRGARRFGELTDMIRVDIVIPDVTPWL